jgi:hypothetical protein
MRQSDGSGIQALQKFSRAPETPYKSLTSAGLFRARVLHFGDGLWALNRLHCVNRDRCGDRPEFFRRFKIKRSDGNKYKQRAKRRTP